MASLNNRQYLCLPQLWENQLNSTYFVMFVYVRQVLVGSDEIL